MDAQARLTLAICQDAHKQALESGHPHFFEGRVAELAEEVGASAQDARQVLRELEERGFLWERSAGFYNAMPSFLLLHEEHDRAEAYRQNQVRRHVLQEVGRFDDQDGWVRFKAGEEPYPMAQLFTAARVLAYRGLVELDGEQPAIFHVQLASEGYKALHDERLLHHLLPVNATEDEEQHPIIAPDALREVIINCEQMLEQRDWKRALVELRRGDAQYREEHWVDAVREYYAALESAFKYALDEEQAAYAEGNALRRCFEIEGPAGRWRSRVDVEEAALPNRCE